MRRTIVASAASCLLGAAFGVALPNHLQTRTSYRDALAGIEKLHQEDIAATHTQDADQLTDLWTDDAVVMEEGSPTVVGKKAIHAGLLQNAAEHPAAKDPNYTPHILDVQILGDMAYEYGYFDDFQPDSHGNSARFRGRFLRVMGRLPNGEWKFARVMWNLDHK